MSTILTDDERPKLPELGPEWTDYWRKTVEQKMEAYADAREAAVLAKLARQEPVGYLPSYEADRLKSGHDARLRSAKFGPSHLDGDVPVYAHPAPQQADRQRVPEDREQWLAVREGHFNEASAEYFNARPHIDTHENRRIFYAGHCKGYEAASTPEAPAQASAVDERAAFEEWVAQQPEGVAKQWWCRQIDDGGYSCYAPDVMWRAWQARAALAQKGGDA